MIIQKKEIRIELYNRLNRNSSIAQDTLEWGRKSRKEEFIWEGYPTL